MPLARAADEVPLLIFPFSCNSGWKSYITAYLEHIQLYMETLFIEYNYVSVTDLAWIAYSFILPIVLSTKGISCCNNLHTWVWIFESNLWVINVILGKQPCYTKLFWWSFTGIKDTLGKMILLPLPTSPIIYKWTGLQVTAIDTWQHPEIGVAYSALFHKTNRTCTVSCNKPVLCSLLCPFGNTMGIIKLHSLPPLLCAFTNCR